MSIGNGSATSPIHSTRPAARGASSARSINASGAC